MSLFLDELTDTIKNSHFPTFCGACKLTLHVIGHFTHFCYLLTHLHKDCCKLPVK